MFFKKQEIVIMTFHKEAKTVLLLENHLVEVPFHDAVTDYFTITAPPIASSLT